MNEDRSTRYHRLKRTLKVGAAVGRGALLVAAAVALRRTGAGGASAIVPTAWPAVGAATVAFCLLLAGEVLVFPLHVYSGFVLERRFGLSRESFRTWCVDQAKASALIGLLGTLAFGALYVLIDWFPEVWWVPASIGFVAVAIATANLAPVVLLPMFYALRPLARESLRQRLTTLADRMGAGVVGAYEWRLGEKTTRANAALTGLGSTRRILVSDTMLSQYSDDEIEVVLAHEIAHHVHRDIWKSIALEGLLALVGFYVTAQVLGWWMFAAGLHGAADPAGLPVVLVAMGAMSAALAPIVHAASRRHERQADRLALETTGNPAAFVSALRRLGAQNLAEERPSKLAEWLFNSHPPLTERMAVARAYEARVSAGRRQPSLLP